MRDKQALYREICKNPYDDTLRLVYADCLEENGDEIQANYIRESIVLQFPPDDLSSMTKLIEHRERFEQAQKVLDAHWEAWVLEHDIVSENYDFTSHKMVWSRGMPDTLKVQRSALAITLKEWTIGELSDEIDWMVKGLPITKIDPGIACGVRNRTGSTNKINSYWAKNNESTQASFFHIGRLPVWLFNATLDETLENLNDKVNFDQDDNGTITRIQYPTAGMANEYMHSALCKRLRRMVYGV